MTMAADLDALAAIPLFHDLTPDQWSSVSAHLRLRTLPAGTRIVTSDQPGEAAYIIVKGTVKILSEQALGGDVILAILGPGEIVGEMSIVENVGRSATAITQEETEIAWIDRASFWTCLQTMPPLSLNLIRILSARLRLANAQIQSLSTLDVYGRVARQILAFADAYGRRAANGDVQIPLRLTQTDLADLVGASRMRVNQVMVAYKRRGYISVDPQHHITVHNAPALAQRCR